MNKKYLFILISLIVMNIAKAQQNEYFDMEPKHTLRKIRENSKNPKVYPVTPKQFTLTAKEKTSKVLNKNYTALGAEIQGLINDSIQVEKVYQSKLKNFVEVSKIKTLIESFLSSPKPYNLKNKNLIDAQKLADSHSVKELIYADANVNSSQKNKFFVLQLDKLDLKVHLKKIT